MGINALVQPGEFIGVFGPNGAGKSTLFAALLGLLPVMGRNTVPRRWRFS